MPWTALNVLKLLINLSLIILPLVDLFYLIDTQSNGTSISDVHIVADIVRAAGYLLALAFMMGCKVGLVIVLPHIKASFSGKGK